MSIKRRPADRGESALAVSRWPLRRKVALALAIPLLLAGTLGGLRVRSDLAEASNSSASARQVAVLRPAVAYLSAAERAMVTVVASPEDDRAVIEEALVDIRTAGRDLLESKKAADLTSEQQHQVDAVLDLSEALRAEDANSLTAGTWEAELRQLHSGVTELITTIVNEQINPQPRLELLSQALGGRFSLAMQQALSATKRTGDAASLELFSELGVEGAAIDRLAGAPGATEKAVVSLRTSNAQRFRTVRTGGTDLGGPHAYAAYDRIIRTLQNGIDDDLNAAAARARVDALLNAAMTLAALVVAVLLAMRISGLLLNPIRRVREGALAVAHERLPEAVARIRAGEDPGQITPIDVTTEEEIGQLARAVDDMHRQAVVLAAGEASLRSQVSQMFITMSRRNTSLINQQLSLIERLERDEEDPKRLESLFRLDHLAARMRRTADSLLVLADAPTATASVDGLTVSDALQAATSGVQDYQRVRVGASDSVRISDSAAADVVHLLTELVDNALSYSPPSSTVTVGSMTTAQGVVIEIADAGLGISAEQLARINDSLGSGGEVTTETTRRMGLFVVSRLSQRHGLTASLHVNDHGGTTARVALPAAILPELAPAPSPEPPEAASRRTPKVAQTAAPEKAVRQPQEPDRKPRSLGSKNKPAVVDVQARIDAALGLPTRTPGATVDRSSGVPTPVSPSTAPAALAALRTLTNGPDPSRAEPHKPAPARFAQTERQPAATPLPPLVEAAAASEPTATTELVVIRPREGVAAPETVPQTGTEPPANPAKHSTSSPSEPPTRTTDLSTREKGATAEPAADPAAPGPEPERGGGSERVRVRRSEPAPKPARGPLAASGALDGDWQDSDDVFDTPIFRSLRSAWLSSGDDAQPWRTSEIEAGWAMADQVAKTPAKPEVSQSGLPVRRPGSRLVPGGVTSIPNAKARDAEAIRQRLAAHASGVSRGRAAAAAATDQSQTEAGS